MRDHPHRVLLDAEDPRELALLAHHAAAARVQRSAPRRRVVGADRGARLHRRAGHALHPGFQPHDVRGARECRVGRDRIAGVSVDADVGFPLVPYARRARPRRRPGARLGGKRLIIHAHELRSVFRRLNRFGHDHGDGFADESRLVRGQRKMRRDEDLRAVAVRETDVRRAQRKRPVRNGFQSVPQEIRAGEDGEDAGRRERLHRVDSRDARMRVR